MKKQIVSLLLITTMLLSLLSTGASAQTLSVSNHWAASAIKTCEEYGVLDLADETYNPDDVITRAEFCSMVNKAFGFTNTTGAKTFTDVDYKGKYGNDIKIASAMGYIEGYGKAFGPTDGLTREQAFTILARIYALSGSATGKTKFADDADISAYARSSINAMSEAGYVNGTGGGKLSPKTKLTKSETAQVIVNLFGVIADKSISADTAYRNLTIRKAGVTVKNATVTGDVFLTDGVGNGDAFFEYVTVKGRTLVTGGGSSSVSFKNSTLNELILSGIWNTNIKLTSSAVKTVTFMASGKLTFANAVIAFDAATGKLTLIGTFDKIVENNDKTLTITVSGTTFTIRFNPSSLLKNVTKSPQPEVPTNYNGGSGGGNNGGGGHYNPTVYVTDVTVSPTSKTLTIGDTVQLTATVSPSNATNKNVTWSSDNTAVATVSTTGLVTAVSVGTANITVITVSGGKTATCAITVNAAIVPATGVTLNKSTTTLIVSETETLNATVAPTNATNKNVTWSSSNTAVVTVDNTGLVTAVSVGSATITVTTVDGDLTATCAVTVNTAYTLTVNNLTAQAAGTYGSVAITTGSATANALNASVTVTATPEPGYAFVKWVTTDDASATDVSTSASYTFPITTDTILYAVFNGDGSSAATPIEIYGAAGLDDMRNGLDKHYKLTADITVSDWIPVGNMASTYRFTGSLDGNGKTVTINNNSDASGHVGLFACIGTSGVVKNLKVAGAITLKAREAGCIAQENFGTIEQCIVTANFSQDIGMNMSSLYIGGITGTNWGTIRNCYTTSDITITSSTGAIGNVHLGVGGITGYASDGITENCYSIGSFSVTDGNRTNGRNIAGGIAGRTSGNQIKNCVALGSSVVASNNVDNNDAGRIVGYFTNGTLMNNYGLSGMTIIEGDSAKALVEGPNEVDGATVSADDAKTQNFYEITLGWDFTDIWEIVAGNDYPTLKVFSVTP